MMDEIRVLSPTAILGYGFPVASFEEGLRREPHASRWTVVPLIEPYYLGSGNSFTQRQAVKRDLKLLIGAALERKIPLIIGTAGIRSPAPCRMGLGGSFKRSLPKPGRRRPQRWFSVTSPRRLCWT